MATLPPHFGPVTVGAENKIEIQTVFWITVGSGSFSAFSDYNAAFSGTLHAASFTGAINLSVTLTDQNPSATSGPAVVVFNGTTDNNASYSVDSGVLTLHTTALPVGSGSYTLQPDESGTDIGGLPLNAWIGT